MFWRTAQTPIASPQLVQKSQPRPPNWLFENGFVSVYPVIEAYQQTSVVAAPSGHAGVIGQTKPSTRLPDVEDEYKRTNHQLYFDVLNIYGLQITFNGYTIEVPDLTGDPWKEWEPYRKPADLYPFRQVTGAPARSSQFNLYYNQPVSPRLDPEPDGKNRQYLDWHIITRMSPTVAKVITSCGVINAYDLGNGTIFVTWGFFGGGPPDSYNVYVNGVLNQNVPYATKECYISGLLQTSYLQGPPPVLVPPTTYTISVTAVSAGIDAAPSVPLTITVQPTTIMLTTAMKRPFPFPNTGNGD
jgi:hypothetical protein